MRVQTIPLAPASIGQSFELTVWHYGREDASRKIYIQASLHADEIPGALVCHHLRQLLDTYADRIQSHIVIVPLANPLGLSQQLLYGSQGRFELGTGQNFNRLGALSLFDLASQVLDQANMQWSSDTTHNAQIVRNAMRQGLTQYPIQTPLESLHHTLVSLAFDADVVLDLHCDWRAVMHTYTTPEGWSTIQPLAQLLGSECQLVADDSGCNPFDEALSTPWLRLAKRYPEAHIPPACTATTIELRGQADVQHDYAQTDAQAIVDFLIHRGDITGSAKPLPTLKAEPRPLAGVERISAPCAGVVVYLAQPGDTVQAEQTVAEVIDPVTGQTTSLKTQQAGFVFACNHFRYAKRCDALMSIAGQSPLAHATLSP